MSEKTYRIEEMTTVGWESIPGNYEKLSKEKAKEAHDLICKVLETCRKEDREDFLKDIIWSLLLDIEQEQTCIDSFSEEMQDNLED